MNKEDKTTKFVKKVLAIFHIKVKPKTEKLFVQIFKFGIVGVIATIIDWAVFYLANDILHIHYAISAILSFTISVIYNYIASVRWVFDVNKKKDPKRNFILFIVFSIIGLILTLIIMSIGVDIFHINAMLMKIIATVIVMVFNFITRKIFLE